MDGLRLLASGLTHSLGGSSRGGGKEDAQSHGLQGGDDTKGGGGLAGAWSSCQHHDFRLHGLADGGHLHFVVLDFCFSDNGLYIDRAIKQIAGACFQQPFEFVGHSAFGIIEWRKEYGILVGDQIFILDHLVKGGGNGFLVGLQQFFGRFQQLLTPGIVVAVFGELTECVENAAPAAAWVIVGITQVLYDGVGCLEANAPNVIGQAIGIVLHLVDAIFPVFFINFGCISGADTMALEKDHDVLHVLLLLPTGSNQGNTCLPYTWDFKQPVYIILYHVKCGQTKMRDDELGKLRTDALDQSVAEVFLNSDDGGRKFLRPRLGCELATIAFVHLPVTIDGEHGTDLHLMKRADKGLLVAETLDDSLKDGIAVLLVLVGDVVNGTLDPLHSV